MAADAVTRLPTQPPTAADDPRDRGGPAQPLLIAQNLEKHFPIRGGMLSRKHGSIKAVDHVSFSVLKGETMGDLGPGVTFKQGGLPSLKPCYYVLTIKDGAYRAPFGSRKSCFTADPARQ